MIDQCKVIYLCIILQIKNSCVGVITRIVSTLSLLFLMLVLGCLCSALVSSQHYPVHAIEQLVFGLTIVICALNDRGFLFLKPVCPLLSRRSFAIYQVIGYLLSFESTVLLLVLYPFYFIEYGKYPSFSCILGLLVVNCVVRLLLSLFLSSFKRNLLCRATLLCVVTCCAFFIIWTKCPLTSFCFYERVNFQIVSFGVGFLLLISYCFYKLCQYAGFDFYVDGPRVTSRISLPHGHISMLFSWAIFKQYFRCYVYKKCVGSMFILMIFGLSLFKMFGGLEYMGAAFIIGAYSLSLLQYSSSFMSHSPDFFFSLSRNCIPSLTVSFLIVNLIVTSLLTILPYLYIKFILIKPILPIIALWLLFCGPIAQILALNLIFPVRFELWSKHNAFQNNIVQSLLRGVAGAVSVTTIILIQTYTNPSCIMCCSFSIVCILFFKKYINFISNRMRSRKYTLLNTLR